MEESKLARLEKRIAEGERHRKILSESLVSLENEEMADVISLENEEMTNADNSNEHDALAVVTAVILAKKSGSMRSRLEECLRAVNAKLSELETKREILMNLEK